MINLALFQSAAVETTFLQQMLRVTMPETALELAALLVLAFDLLFLRRAKLAQRNAAAILIGVLGCVDAIWTLPTSIGQSLTFDGSALLATGGYAAVAQIGLYIMAAFAKRSNQSAEAALKYYLFGGMSAAFLLFGFSYLYGLAGSTNLWEIQKWIFDHGASPLLYVAWVLIIAGLGFKIAAVPFHLWAPDAYEGAPAPAAAFIASASKVASFALAAMLLGGNSFLFVLPHSLGSEATIRIYNQFVFFETRVLGILLIVSAASMIIGNLLALAQSNVRRIVAYSAIAHAGYILLGICRFQQYIHISNTIRHVVITNSRSGITFADHDISVLYYLITYGFTTIGLFAIISVVERASGSADLGAFAGLHRRNPLLAAMLLVMLLSLAGIPPLAGFWAKFYLFASVLAASVGNPVALGLVILAIAMSAVSLYYYLQVLKRAYVAAPLSEEPIKANPLVMIILAGITASVVIFGCFPVILQSWIAAFFG